MTLLKGFFRNKKIKNYIIIFVTIYLVLLILNGFGEYYDNRDRKLKLDQTYFYLFSSNNQDNYLNSKDGVKYQRFVEFSTDKKRKEEIIENSSLKWNHLVNFRGFINAYPESYCDATLDDNQIIIATYSYDYLIREVENFDSYIDNNIINLIHNGNKLDFVLSKIIDTEGPSFVCLSSSKFNELLKKEEKYNYFIKANAYETLEEIYKDSKDKKGFDTYEENYDPDSLATEHVKKVATILRILNYISIVIFLILIIYSSKDIVEDLEFEFNLFKQIGFSTKKIIYSTFRNLVVFDLLVLVISSVISTISLKLINNIYNFNLNIFNMKLVGCIFIFHILSELIWLLLHFRKGNELDEY